MDILVVGSGGREHTLCWKIAQSPRVDKVYCAPGNGGISSIAECVDIKADDIDTLTEFAQKKKIDLTVVGPEAPLVNGIVDEFNKKDLKIFGPDKYIAQLEGSKVFAKQKMVQFGLRTADFKIFNDPQSAKSFVAEKEGPYVVKADGLCAGKGVIIANSRDDAFKAIDEIMVDKAFGSAGEKVIIEDCLDGEEVSVILVSDGKDFVIFPPSQDHKRAYDDDQGPNTGGMGAYSPVPIYSEELQKKINDKIIKPLIQGFLDEGNPCKGVIYLGLMIVDNEPYVLEFNVRFGDPEAQVILTRLKSDLVDILLASIEVNIKDVEYQWDERACVCIVCASGGYPGTYKKGISITGLDEASKMKDVIVFHAGTKISGVRPPALRADRPGGGQGTGYSTNGGRVLGVTAYGDDIKSAIDKAYEACKVIKFEDMHYRKDIGRRAIKIQN
ncbi:phosphoribosylamine--glycine ligase [Candidatus Omnitrophota bacterium]